MKRPLFVAAHAAIAAALLLASPGIAPARAETAPLGAASAAASASAAEAASAKLAQRILSLGSAYWGAPYQFGADPNQTAVFDCSSFVQRAFRDAGITLPRTTGLQYELGTAVDLSRAKPGDLVFFKDSANPAIPGHVGIYAGGMNMLHAGVSGGVKIVSIATAYWTERYLAVRRVLPQTYSVAAGDTLWKIASAQRVGLSDLIAWNRINPDALVPGQLLYLSDPNLPEANIAAAKTYVVQAGDTFWLIAQRTGIPIDTLRAANGLTGDSLYVGQTLLIPAL